jgi:hypothetical protein
MISLTIALFVLLYALYIIGVSLFFNCSYVLILAVILAKNASKFLLFLK